MEPSGPVGVQVPVAGSYSSATVLSPPATSTLPEGSSVAVWPWWLTDREATGLHVPVSGSYSSAEPRAPDPVDPPPTTSTWPEGNSVAV